MDDLNDLYYFSVVVQHNGFSAASRATGVEKTRLSRRVAALEKRLGVRLLQRTTRSLSLTEAGAQFYDSCTALIEGARGAYDSVARLRREPAGTVRICSPVVMAQSYLAAILPDYMASFPKVRVQIEATDRDVNLIEERFDLVLRTGDEPEDLAGLVVRPLGGDKRILVASPAFLQNVGRPRLLADLARLATISRDLDIYDESACWKLEVGAGLTELLRHRPVLTTNDLRLQLEAAIRGIGVALLPEPIAAAAIRKGQLEQVLPDWSASQHRINLIYPSPRGMLPSVRSLIDYLLKYLPSCIRENGLDVDPLQYRKVSGLAHYC